MGLCCAFQLSEHLSELHTSKKTPLCSTSINPGSGANSQPPLSWDTVSDVFEKGSGGTGRQERELEKERVSKAETEPERAQ